MFSLFFILVSLSIYLIYNYIRDFNLLKKVTKPNRGTWSERRLVLKLLKSGIPPQNIFHDLYIKKSNGGFSQIDIVVITGVGIIVIEVKHFNGWVYGMGNRNKWVQVFNYGKNKYSFYNPVFQNDLHIQSLKNKINSIGNLPFYSLIVFYGKCVLKNISNIPETTKIVKSERVMEVINPLLENQRIFTEITGSDILKILNEGVQNGENKEIQIQHFENVKRYLSIF
jgi:hypothetical protein